VLLQPAKHKTGVSPEQSYYIIYTTYEQKKYVCEKSLNMDCQFKLSFKPGEKESKKLESDEAQNFYH